MNIALISLVFSFSFFSLAQGGGDDKQYQVLTIAMPKLETKEDDTYMCLTSSVKDIDADIVGFNINAVKGTVHHISWAVCEDVNTNRTIWKCRSQQGHICSGRSINFGGWDGWAKGHDVEMMDEDVGVRIGKAARLNNVILQIHFKYKTPSIEMQETNTANLTIFLSKERRPFTMQKYLTESNGYVPANTHDFSSQTACFWEKIPVAAFRYTIHTHDYGKLVEAYVISNGTSKLIARGVPHGKRHDTFPIIGGQTPIYPGDIIAARCVYDNDDAEDVAFGMTGRDEMCNFDMDFKYSSSDALAYPNSVRCVRSAQASWWKNIFPLTDSASSKL